MILRYSAKETYDFIDKRPMILLRARMHACAHARQRERDPEIVREQESRRESERERESEKVCTHTCE